MTRQDLQKEIKEKVKPGVKPSDLRKLKRSKSLSDIPKMPLPKSTPLVKSKSAQELEPTNSKIEALETKISVLELKLETSQRELVEKDIEIESLQKQLTPSKELDQNLTKRHQNLKDWFAQYQKSKKLDAELTENIDEASTELVNQGQTISNLRTENFKLKQTNQSLQGDLKLSQRLVELRRTPLPNSETWPQFPFNWITLALALFALWIWIKPQTNDL